MNDADRMADALEVEPIEEAADTVVTVTALGGPLAEAAAQVMVNTGLPTHATEPAALATLAPGRALVAFVAHPAWLLAQAADAAPSAAAIQPGTDLHAVRAHWITAARGLLTRVQNEPGDCLLLAADEVLAAAQDSVALITRTFGATPGASPASRPLALPTVPAPAGLALARLAVSQDAPLRRLWEELLASSTPLSNSSVELEAAPTFDDLAQALRDQAVQRQALDAARGERSEQARQLQILRDERQGSHAALAATATEIASLKARHQDQARELLDLQDRQQLTLLHWQQAREELDQAVSQVEALTAQRDAALAQATQASAARQTLDEQLRQILLQRDCAQAERDAARQQHAQALAEVQQQLQALHGRLQEQTAQRDAARQQHAQALAGVQQQLQEQTASSQAALSAQQALLQQRTAELTAARDEAHRALAASRAEQAVSDQRLQASMRTTQALQDEVATRAAEVDRLRAGLNDAEAQRAESQRRLELAERSAADATARVLALEQSSDRLSAQLLAAVAGLESAAAVPRTDNAAGLAPPLQVGSIDLVGARDEAPHRELSFTFHDWACPTGTLDTTTVRLIEHLGHPGLVIFAAADGRAPLTQWQPVGNEDGRPFMILLPHDQHPDAPMSRMASADWRLVNSLAALLAQELRTLEGESLHPHWRDIAARLHLAIGVLPARLRYAELRGTPSEQGLEIVFEDVVQGARSWDRLRLVWRPTRDRNGGAPLVWTLPAGYAAAPLAAWPCREDGTLAPECALPFGPGASAATSKAWLNALPGPDRDLLLAVFDALPAVAAQGGVPAALANDVRALQRAARAAVSGLRLRRIARRMLGRIVGRA